MNYIDRLQRFCLGKYELLMMKKGLSIENDGTMMVQFLILVKIIALTDTCKGDTR